MTVRLPTRDTILNLMPMVYVPVPVRSGSHLASRCNVNRKSWHWFAILLISLLALAGAGCNSLGGEEIETPAATSEPAGNQVVFTAPYRAVLDAGDSVPGAQLQYVGQDDDGIHVRIDGEEAYKKTGDSFNWSGSPAAGVELDYKLRVVGVVLNVFQAWGDVDITILDPDPVVTELPEDAPLTFTAAVATYSVAKGDSIPGTTCTYLGKSAKGAEFGGVEGYAYREIADSLDWSGRVRDNVYVDLTLRISSIREDEVTLVGTAAIWIFP